MYTEEYELDWDHYTDYKEASIAYEAQKQARSDIGWIYIGGDHRDHRIAKVGLTTGKLGTRASSSQNPSYSLLYAFKVKHGVSSHRIHEIENATIAMLAQNFLRVDHYRTVRPSEWFHANPLEIRQMIHDFLYMNYSNDMYSYWCPIRDEPVIRGWENSYDNHRQRYVAKDLSNPPVAPECYQPGGCGNDCNCW